MTSFIGYILYLPVKWFQDIAPLSSYFCSLRIYAPIYKLLMFSYPWKMYWDGFFSSAKLEKKTFSKGSLISLFIPKNLAARRASHSSLHTLYNSLENKIFFCYRKTKNKIRISAWKYDKLFQTRGIRVVFAAYSVALKQAWILPVCLCN